MITLRLLIMIVAFVCLLMSALGITSTRVNLQSTGLALWLLSIMIV